jgi:Xaa-Pro aminopeptidase
VPIYNRRELDRLFREAGLDAIVARTGQSVTYLGGVRLPGTLGRLQDFADSPRAALLVMSRAGDAVLIVSRIAAALARETSWIERIETYVDYQETPYDLAEAVIAEFGFQKGRIGVERGALSVDFWELFTSHLSDAELVDCTEMLERVRSIKTTGEVAILKQSAALQDHAFIEVLGNASIRSTERGLHAEMIAALARRGAEGSHGMMQASSTATPYGGERDVLIRTGDLIRTDYVSYYDRYPANLSRMAVMGPPTPTQIDEYTTLRAIHYETIETTLRAGRTASDVYEFVRRRVQEEGLGTIPGLVGHSLGIWWHQEHPFLVPNENRELEPGMVICLEPVMRNFWHIQDEILIGEDDPTILSDGFDTAELYRIG